MEAYRVRKEFQWGGMIYAPKGPSGECKCPCSQHADLKCSHLVGTGCNCRNRSCRCSCGIKQEQYAGDVWMVEDGHPRKEHIINNHFATYDASLPSVDELMNQNEQPEAVAKRGRPKAAVA